MKNKNEAIVLIHGIWMTGLELCYLRVRFWRSGYRVYTFHYHSLLRTPEQSAEKLARFIDKVNEPVMHFVAHSMGGIVLCHLFNQVQVARPGKVILLGAPVNGSAVARVLSRHRLFKYLLGKSVVKGLLENGSDWICQRPTCVIAGSKAWGLGQLFTPGAMSRINDGTVNLEETVVQHAGESHLVPHTHFSMLISKQVFTTMLTFLTRTV